jgi:hypothetical protein
MTPALFCTCGDGDGVVWPAAIGAGLLWSTSVWFAPMRVLKKLNERHRQAVRLLVRGKKFVEIAEELGGHPYYWGQIAKTPLMRGEIERCRQQVDNAWLRAEEARQLEVLGVGKLGALIRNRRKQRQRRQDRPMTPFVAERIAERAAKAAASPLIST